MLASVRHAVARVSFRRAANIRTLTDNAAADAVKHAAPEASEAGLLSSISPSSQVSNVASTSSSVSRANPSAAQPVIHIPPAEDPLLALFTNFLMFNGQRQRAAKMTSKMLLHIHAFTKAPPMPILRQAVMTAAPLLRCRQFKRAAKQFVFPMPLNERQRARQAIKWIWEASHSRGGKQMAERLAREVIAVVKGESPVLKQKSDRHQLAVLHRGNVLRPPRIPKSNKV
ncbi:ribosomal protein S7 [Pilatotrama ljubarskyi]|nr:ribosomal protein S7 [Pilatotrama ljubarskyi]